MFSFRKIFKYIYLFIKPYKLAFFSLFFFATGRIVFSNIVIGFIYKNIVDILSNVSIPAIDRYHIVLLFLIPMSITFAISMTMTRYGEWVQYRFLSKAIKNAYDFSFERLSMHSNNFYTNNFTGSLVAKVKRFVKALDTITSTVVLNFWIIIIVILSSTVALYFQSKILAFYFMGWCLVYCLLIFFFVKQKINLDMRRAEADSKLTAVLSDSITNMTNIKSFSAFPREFKYFQEVTKLVKDTRYATYKFTIIRSAFQALLMTLFHLFILFIMIHLWLSGEITVGVFVMTYVYLMAIIDRLWDLSSAMTNFMEAMTDIQEMVDIFETNIEVKDSIHPEKSEIKDGVIEFKNVSFKYKEGADVLSGFNLKINKGEKIGLIGHSGSGKSTITKILLRFADVDDGEILIDGQNIVDITQDDLRRAISYVPQESILFHRSIRDNIGYSKDNATDDEIKQAAEFAHSDIFINQLPKGYNTLVGERGVKLSGGERQRVSIARAMLKNSPILILDEATSSLDSMSEKYIQDSFIKLMEGRTTIVIAHRLSTIQKMDRIIVLEDGKIVEEGTHTALIKKGGKYADLWNHQVGGFIE